MRSRRHVHLTGILPIPTQHVRLTTHHARLLLVLRLTAQAARILAADQGRQQQLRLALDLSATREMREAQVKRRGFSMWGGRIARQPFT